MPNETIDTIKIEIKSDSTQGVKGIESLINTLKKIDSAVNNSNKGLSKISRMFESIKKAGESLENGKLNSLADTLEKVGNTKISSSVASQLRKIGAAVDNIDVNKLEKISDIFDKFNGTNFNVKIGESISKGVGKANQLIPDLKNAISGEVKAPDLRVDESVDKARESISELKTEMNGVGNSFSRLRSTSTAVVSSVSRAFKSLNGVIKSVSPTVKKVGKAMMSITSMPLKGLAKGFSRITDKAKGFVRSLGRIAFYRAIRSALKAITQGFSEGLMNAYKFSQLSNGALANSLDKIATSSLYLKNSLGAMAAPLINLLAPAIDYIVDKFVALMNVINQVFAKLSGQKTWLRAKRSATTYEEAVGGATDANKKFKASLLGIDEINALSDALDSASGAGGGTDYGSMFEEVPLEGATDFGNFLEELKNAIDKGDWNGVGSLISDKFIETMNKIEWEKVYAKASNFGKGLADFLNGLFETKVNPETGELENVFTAVGKTLAGALNTAFSFLDSFGETFDWAEFGNSLGLGINKFLNDYDWDKTFSAFENWAKGFADLINGFFDGTDWSKVGETISNAFAALITFLDDFVENLDFKNIGDKIGLAISNLKISADLGLAAKTLSDILGGLIDTATELIEGLDWWKLGDELWKSIVAIFKNIAWGDLISKAFELLGAALGGSSALIASFAMSFWNSVKKGFESVKSYFDTFIDEAGGNVVVGLWNGIINAIKNVGTWIKEHIFDPFINGFKAAFGIHSPSTVMAEMGGYIIEGLLNGLKNAWESIKKFFSKKVEEIQEKFSEIWSKITDFSGEVWVKFSAKVSDSWKKAVETWNNLKEGTKTLWAKFKDWVSDTWESTKKGWEDLKEKTKEFVASFKEKVSKGWEAAKTAWANLKEGTKSFIASFKEKISDGWESAKKAWNALKEGTKNLVMNLKEKISNGWQAAKDKWDSLKEKAKNLIANFKDSMSKTWDSTMQKWNNLKEKTKTLVAELKEKGQAAWQKAVDGWNNLKEGTKSLIAHLKKKADSGFETAIETWDKIKSGTKELTANLSAKLKTGWETVKGWWDTILSWFRGGSNEDRSFSIGAVLGAVKDTVSGWWQKIKEWFFGSKGESGNKLEIGASLSSSTEKDARTNWWDQIVEWWGERSLLVRLLFGSSSKDKEEAQNAGKEVADEVVKGYQKNTGFNQLYTPVTSSLTSKMAKTEYNASGKAIADDVEKGVDKGWGTKNLPMGATFTAKEKLNGANATWWTTIRDSYWKSKNLPIGATTAEGTKDKIKGTGSGTWWSTFTSWWGSKKLTVGANADTSGFYSDGQKAGSSFSNGFNNSAEFKVKVKADLQELYASGYSPVHHAAGAYGIPNGEIFIAREAGPEMVGVMGSKTAVANNDQIVEGISEGVYAANAEQNALLRQQNAILMKLLEKETNVTAVVSTASVVDGLERNNRRTGKTVVPVAG